MPSPGGRVTVNGIASHVGTEYEIPDDEESLRERLEAAERRIAELESRVGIDTLTRLPRRSILLELIRRNVDRRRPFAVIMFDLDNFKHVNDAHGHDVGDELLVRAAEAMVRSVRDEGDQVFRLAGDEFCVVLREGYGAYHVASRIRQTVVHELRNWGAGCSMGIATHPDDADHAEGLLKMADLRMLSDKRARKVPTR